MTCIGLLHLVGYLLVLKLYLSNDFCRAMLCNRGLSRHAVSVCLSASVCPSVTFVDSVETKKTHLQTFFTFG